MERETSRAQPPIPADVAEAGRLLEENHFLGLAFVQRLFTFLLFYVWLECEIWPIIFFSLALDGVRIFYHVAVGNDIALLFINEELLHALVNCEEKHMDATFDAVPRQLYITYWVSLRNSLCSCKSRYFYESSLLSVFLVDFEMYYLFIYVFSRFILMTHKHRKLYEAALQSIVAKCVTCHVRAPAPVRVVSDYEMAILRAVDTTFPNAKARGFLFHSSQERNGNLNINILNTYLSSNTDHVEKGPFLKLYNRT